MASPAIITTRGRSFASTSRTGVTAGRSGNEGLGNVAGSGQVRRIVSLGSTPMWRPGTLRRPCRDASVLKKSRAASGLFMICLLLATSPAM